MKRLLLIVSLLVALASLSYAGYQTPLTGAGQDLTPNTVSAATITATVRLTAATVVVPGNAVISSTGTTLRKPIVAGLQEGLTAGAGVLNIFQTDRTPANTTGGNISLWTTDAQAINKGGSLTFGGTRDDAAVSGRVFGAINGAKENSTTGNSAGYISLLTNANESLLEAVRIDSSQRVGIGTASPGHKLEVINDTNTGVVVSSGPGGNGWLVGNDCSNASRRNFGFAQSVVAAGDAALKIGTNNCSDDPINGSGTRLMTFSAAGVGVGSGVSTPQTALYVLGDATITTDLTAASGTFRNAAASQLRLGSSGGENYYDLGRDTADGAFYSKGSQAGFGFFRWGNVDYANTMVLFAGGQLWVGGSGTAPAAPAATLDVNGSAQFGSGATKSTFTATGDLYVRNGSSLTIGLGTGVGRAMTVGKFFYHDYTTDATASTTNVTASAVTAVSTLTIPASALARNGDCVLFVCSGVTTAASVTKTARIDVGAPGNQCANGASSLTNASWEASCRICRTASNAQITMGVVNIGQTMTNNQNSKRTQTDTGAIPVYCEIFSAAQGEMSYYGSSAFYEPAP